MDKMRKISTAFSIAIIATATLECSTINAQTVITFNKNGISNSTKGASKKNIKTIDTTTFEVTYKMFWFKNPDDPLKKRNEANTKKDIDTPLRTHRKAKS